VVYLDTSVASSSPSSNETVALNDVQRAAVEALQADGIAVVSFVDLFGEQLWNDAKADIAPFIRETEDSTQDVGPRPAGKEEVIVRRFFDKAGEKEKPSFSIDSPWLRIAASEALIDIVNAYRQSQTRLFYLDNWFTVPYPEAGDRVASQRWHRDPEDEHIVKVFVYFSDVDEEAGPFEYIRGSAAGGRYGDLWSWSEGHRYPPSEELEAAVAPEDRFLVTGTAGTIIICDTGGFHRGGFARTKPRILSISTYLRPDRKEGKRRFEIDFSGRESELEPRVLAALS
jgi:hypothetical protein